MQTAKHRNETDYEADKLTLDMGGIMVFSWLLRFSSTSERHITVNDPMNALLGQ